jgi:extracellular elastinolytic metalloproteinase
MLTVNNTDNISSSTPSITVASILLKTEELLEGKYNGHPPTLEYLARPNGFVSLVHVVQIRNEEADTWYEAFIDAHSGELLSITDFVSDASVNGLRFFQ